MSQSLTRLPKTAKIKMEGWNITIENYRVTHGSFWYITLLLIGNSSQNRDTLYKIEKQGFSFEMVIEYYIRELEEDAEVFAGTIDRHYGIRYIEDGFITWEELVAFSKSVAGRKIAEQLIEKIRSCDNWDDLYDEMQPTGKFHTEMKQKIKEELKQQCRKA